MSDALSLKLLGFTPMVGFAGCAIRLCSEDNRVSRLVEEIGFGLTLALVAERLNRGVYLLSALQLAPALLQKCQPRDPNDDSWTNWIRGATQGIACIANTGLMIFCCTVATEHSSPLAASLGTLALIGRARDVSDCVSID